jgi:hypothetical protein
VREETSVDAAEGWYQASVRSFEGAVVILAR